MIVTVLLSVLSFALPPLYVRLMRLAMGLPVRCPRFFSHWALGAAGMTAGTVIAGAWPEAASSGASVLLALVLWWYSRRKRKRSLRQLGNKARARLAAMARNMPRPSPRLVPQGARA